MVSTHGAGGSAVRWGQVALLAIPWLNPFASGPSPAVLPWLVSVACAVGVWLLWWRPALKSLAAGWLVAATLSACIGISQYFGQATALSPWVSVAGVSEAFANLRQRNQFASLTNIGLLALLWFAAQHHRGKSWMRLLVAALLAIGNAASSSRTGLSQLVLIALATGIWGGWRRIAVREALGVALTAYLAASITLPLLIGLEWGSSGILGRLKEGAPACANRVILWGNVLYLIAQKPWLGWGWGALDFAHFTTLYPGERFCEILDNAHNLPMHVAVELGVPVALVFCGLMAWLVWRAKPWREHDAGRQMAWGVLAVIGLHSLLEYPLWYGPFQIAVVLCVWILRVTPTAQIDTHLSAHRGQNGKPVSEPPQAHDSRLRPACVAVVVFSVGMFTCLAYAVWDYHRISQIYIAPADRLPVYRANTLGKIKGSWLFRDHVRFAELTLTPVTPHNAARLNAMAHELLYFSPEARVAEKLIGSAHALGKSEEAEYFMKRYEAAYPDKFRTWLQGQPGR